MLQKTAYGVRRLCRVLGVSKTAYYEHRGRDGGASTSDWSDAHDAQTARAAWAEHPRVYGARRLTAELRHRGHRWNRKKVADADACGRRRGRPSAPPRQVRQAVPLDSHRPGPR
ncbi:hypothetical protein GCM10011374_23850 [Kocuria dechangensis]|uniref:HTH-like domain-containing protein n=1 Tax=Kocuria dechangensis TaxID=1176249 RepID=A0A917GXH5_9MICC|nr:hypothetical protein GCM10011374_23850 [Kocuria dechangensis]